MHPIRQRSLLDDKHGICDPLLKQQDGVSEAQVLESMDRWSNTLAKTRIAELFLTVQGLPGHSIQIQQELNRLTQFNGYSGKVVTHAIHTSYFLRNALEKAKQAAAANGFVFPNEIELNFPLINNVIKI